MLALQCNGLACTWISPRPIFFFIAREGAKTTDQQVLLFLDGSQHDPKDYFNVVF